MLGVAAAYVLLGERHADGEYPPHPDANAATIPSVPFRIQKSTRRLSLSAPAVTNVHGTKWMEELKIMCDTAEGKLALGGKELQRPEVNRGPDAQQPKKFHEGDLYLCRESLEALEGSLGAVCDAVDAVFKENGPKRAFVAVRPPGHHCSADWPSGFCWVNNVHVGIMHAILAHGLTHAAIIDFDLHHGDGSQAITWQHNSRGMGLAKNAAFWKKASIGYYSLHDINSYPCELGDEEKVKNASLCIDNAHGQHVWNVHLESWKTEAEFWEFYEDKYTVLLEKARKYLKSHTERLRMSNQTSKAAIFFSAGFDASEWEGAGMQRHSVNVPTGFYARIARDVTKIAQEEGTSVDGRVISVLEGGYSDRALTSGVLSHISGLAGSDPTPMSTPNGLGSEMTGRNGMGHTRQSSLEAKLRPHAYDPSWWNSESLDILEHGVVLSPPQPKATRNFSPGNYSSPTTSSTAKMVEVARLRRQASINGIAPPRPPTPPPPVVFWHVAAHGLCSVLTPTDRTTTSCRPEELSAEATRLRRELHMARAGIIEESAPAAPVRPGPSRMSLRERKIPKSYFEGSDDDELSKSRRKTVAGTLPASGRVRLIAFFFTLMYNQGKRWEREVDAGHAISGGATANLSQTEIRNSMPDLGQPPVRQTGRRFSSTSTVPRESIDVQPSAYATARPATSMTERPETSMSVRTSTTGPALQVKKTRTSTAAKKDAPPKSSRAKKNTTAATKTSSKTNSPTRPESSHNGANNDGDDLDKIVSGIKKITLVTNKQKQARAHEAKKASGTSMPTAEDQANAQSVPVAPMAESFLTQGSSHTSNRNKAPQTSISKELEPEIKQETLATHLVNIPDAGTAEVTTPTAVAPPATAQTSIADNFVHYQPDGPTPETLLTPQQPLNWLPVNTGATPTPAKPEIINDGAVITSLTSGKQQEQQQQPANNALMSPSPMKRGDLPVFTPTSQLRFANPRPGEQKVDDDVWEVPETPQ